METELYVRAHTEHNFDSRTVYLFKRYYLQHFSQHLQAFSRIFGIEETLDEDNSKALRQLAATTDVSQWS